MYGAILGDIIGSPYEFDMGDKTKDFPLFCRESTCTDDSVMTIAVAEALMDSMGKTDEEIRKELVASMQKWGRQYPHAGYGSMFRRWLRMEDPQPYGSYGNGSAMRVSSVGWLFDTLEETLHMAELSAAVTHNHPEGIKGAQATAAAIFMAGNGKTKEEIKSFIEGRFRYDLNKTMDDIVSKGHGGEICQVSVPQALVCFLHSDSYMDTIRKAVSIGGDSDTIACIAGGIAEAFYGMDDEYRKVVYDKVDDDLRTIIKEFIDVCGSYK